MAGELTPIGRYESRSFAFSVLTDVGEAARLVETAFADLAVGETAAAAVTYELREDSNGLELWADGLRVQHFPRVGAAVDHLVAAVNQRVLDASAETLNLHAAAVVDADDRAVLLPGVSGAGKTTLCVALLRAGLAYLTDEMVGVDPVDLTLLGYPKALTVKDGSRRLLEGHLDFGPFSGDDDGQTRWYVPVGAVGDAVVRSTATGHAVVFARRIDGAEPSLDAVPRAESVLRLLLNTFDLGRFGPGGVELMARLVSSCHCAVATYGDADAVAPLVSELLATPVDPVDFVPLPAHQPTGRPAGGSIDPWSSPEPRAGVVGVAFADGGVVYDPAEGRTLLLDRIGAAVWPLFDGGATLGDLADELTGHFDADADEIRRDLVVLGGELAESGFLAGIEAGVDPPDWRTALTALDQDVP